MRSKLDGKRILVTGAGQGLGQAIAIELLEHGCHLALHYRKSREGAQSVADEAARRGLPCHLVVADLTVESEATALAQQAAAALGGLDGLVNNAGDLLGRRSLEQLDEAFWRRSFEVNLTSMMLVTRAAEPFLAAAGMASVVNLSSLAGRKGGHAGSLAYSTFKGGVLAWTRAVAAELGPKGIRVNALAPGLILGTRFHATHTTEESARQTVAGIPLGRAGCPADVARAVAFLLAEYDGFITGATLDINGGVYCA
jgi:3-oxoacyl-[acyl-carrier protein] reductase